MAARGSRLSAVGLAGALEQSRQHCPDFSAPREEVRRLTFLTTSMLLVLPVCGRRLESRSRITHRCSLGSERSKLQETLRVLFPTTTPLRNQRLHDRRMAAPMDMCLEASAVLTQKLRRQLVGHWQHPGPTGPRRLCEQTWRGCWRLSLVKQAGRPEGWWSARCQRQKFPKPEPTAHSKGLATGQERPGRGTDCI